MEKQPPLGIVDRQVFEIGRQLLEPQHQLAKLAEPALKVIAISLAERRRGERGVGTRALLDLRLQMLAAKKNQHRGVDREHDRDQRRNRDHGAPAQAAQLAAGELAAEQERGALGARAHRLTSAA
ncbi:MAG: hypothetical protein HC897_19275 [Thermoanaerobaculia bacterium]|nr:hypothetical protein [Thermoanaerobaculia bacterium]